MGCWNGSCQASGLSIRHGQRIVVIPLIRQDREWKACWYPIRGEYNDYGSIENVDENFITDHITKQFLEEINKENGKISLGRRFDERFDKKPTDIEDIVDILERETCIGNIVSTKTFMGDETSLSYCMVLETVYDWMVKNHNRAIEDWRRKFFKNSISKFKKAVKASTEILNNNVSTKKTIKNYKSLFGIGDSYNLLDRLEEYYSYAGGIGFPIGEINAENVDEYIKIMIEFKSFLTAFNKLRISFTPPAMAGHQDDNSEFRIRFNNAVNKLTREEIKRYEEECDGL